MTTLSIRLPDDMAERLKNIAKVRDISLKKLMFELSTQALAEEDDVVRNWCYIGV